MTMAYRFDRDSRTLHAFPRGSLSPDAVKDYVGAVLADSDIPDGFLEIVHFDDVDDFEFSYSEAVDLTEVVGRLRSEKNYVGTILVGRTDFQFGVACMMASAFTQSRMVMAVRGDEDLREAAASLRAAWEEECRRA